MPNGGPDCCGNCSYNKAVQKMAHPQPEKTEEFWKISYCTLRDINITNPFWTYCSNFIYGKKPEERNKSENPIGWITASGLYEGYVRIPWNGKIEPKVSVPVTCSVCQRIVDDGIKIEHNADILGFCTNRHYLEWWASIHKSKEYNPEDYISPEEKYPNILEMDILNNISDKMARGIAKKSFTNSLRKNLSIVDFIDTIIKDLRKSGKFTDETKVVVEKLKERAVYESKRRNLE
jgi:hypothetical protein|tara:strand:- start:136 stop:837 length:702 start_codon:yes stop_codon:yes gene_type:complete